MKKTKKKMQHPKNIRRYNVRGSRRLDNYLWSSFLFVVSSGFLFAGLSSWFNCNFFYFVELKNLVFFPQGIVMCFYGILGLIFSFYFLLTALWNVGSGYNEFNRDSGFVHIFRWGFPGRNRRVDLFYTISNIKEIRVSFHDGSNWRQTIYMRVVGKRDIPLEERGETTTWEAIESEAYELATFLQVPLELS